MRDRRALQGHGGQVLLSVLQALADRFGDFGCFAEAEAHAALAVTHDDECGELCDAAALNGLGNAVEGNDFFGEFLGLIAAAAAIVPSVIVICHFVSSSR